MTDIDIPATRLWTPQGFRDDDWRRVEDLAAVSEQNSRFILPLAALLETDSAARGALAGRLGVEVLPGEPLDQIVPLLPELALVALAFPGFADGRSFSRAELLRRRHGYAGPLRATGEVLIDLVPHMLRTGFDEFEISDATALARLEEGRIGGLPLHYQPAAKPAEAGAGYSWRRTPVA